MHRGGIFAVAGQEERDDFLTGLDVQTSVREEEEEEEEEGKVQTSLSGWS